MEPLAEGRRNTKEADVFHASIAHDGTGPERAGRPQVLVVDDDDDLRAAISDVLRGAGFATIDARNGSAALDYLLATAPSLILLDMKMPLMSGPETIRVLQGYVRFSTIPVLVMTSEVPRAQPLEEGTVGRLQKPFSSRQLLALVRRYARPARVDE